MIDHASKVVPENLRRDINFYLKISGFLKFTGLMTQICQNASTEALIQMSALIVQTMPGKGKFYIL